VLLVERGLGPARLILIGRPEARAVGRENFVDENQLFGRRRAAAESEFELRIRDDDPALACVLCGSLVDVGTPPAQLLGCLGANDFDHSSKSDVLIVTA